MKGLITDKRFLIGVAVGAVVVPVLLAKVAPGAKAKLPGQSSTA